MWQEFEDDGDWVEKFIQVVESKPPIYNSVLTEHSDRNLISRLWHEVCQAMIPQWQDMTSNEKSLKVKDLQSRWRNLRTCFRRELNKQKQDKSGQSAKKRRKYVYFDQLLFLLPTMEDIPTAIECNTTSTRATNSESEDEPPLTHQARNLLDSDGDDFNHTPQTCAQNLASAPTSCKIAKTKRTHEKPVANVSKEKEQEALDEDKLFLLSLVPTFKKLTDVQKIDAKIEFLTTLKRMTQPTQGTFCPMPPEHHGAYASYGLHGLAEYYLSKKNSPSHYNYSVENYPSGSSTPNPVPSDASRASKGSNLESVTPNQDDADF